MIEVPPWLEWWRGQPGGAGWLERLLALAFECVEAWELELGPPYPGGAVSFAAPAVRADGSAAVLKLNFPEPETEHEADALAFWDGFGAVRLLEHDPGRRALLVERCEPGTQLWSLEDERDADLVAATVLRRLWRRPPEPHRFALLSDRAAEWVDAIPAAWEALRRPLEAALVERVVAFLGEAGPSQGEPVVLHQDFHGGNVLRSARGWMAIDPNPLVGEREYDVGWLVTDRPDALRRDPSPGRQLRRRLDWLAGELELDRERARWWGVAHVLAWGSWEGGWDDEVLMLARLLAEA
jgi:streptomycin 6-kinase